MEVVDWGSGRRRCLTTAEGDDGAKRWRVVVADGGGILVLSLSLSLYGLRSLSPLTCSNKEYYSNLASKLTVLAYKGCQFNFKE